MIGDLSMRPSGAVDPVPSVRGAPEGPTRQRTAAASAPPPAAFDNAATFTQRASAPNDQVDRLRAMLTDPDTRVRTHRDEASGRTVIEIESLATGETVDQIPNEELLRLYAAIRQPLVDERA